jgi:hypothetical protein
VSPIIDNDLDIFGPYWDTRLGKEQDKKSLTALILTTEDTPDGPVAVYGLPITSIESDEKKTGRVGGSPGRGRWRTLKDGRHVMVSTNRVISGATMARVVEDVQKVVQKGKATGMEYATAFDRDGSPVAPMVGGTDATACNVGSLLEAGDDEFVLVHNHPSSTPFSEADVMGLWASDLEHVIAAGHDGTIYRMSRTDETSSLEFLSKQAQADGAPPWEAFKARNPDSTRQDYNRTMGIQYLTFEAQNMLKKYKAEASAQYMLGKMTQREAMGYIGDHTWHDFGRTYGVQYEVVEP